MDRQAADLGIILKQFPNFEFSMENFDGRLRLQKFVYTLQMFDIYLGYDFSWYLRGPYCHVLATCAFQLERMYNKIPDDIPMKFVDASIERRFKRFKQFIKGHEKDTDFLEIVASIHYLKSTQNDNKDAIIERVAKKRRHFTHEQCHNIWNKLEERLI